MKNVRKALSLLLAVSMILALIVVPTTASAELVEVEGTVAISYKTDATSYYPGQTVNVDVYLTATNDIKPLTEAEIYVAYNNTVMDYVVGSFAVNADLVASANGTVTTKTGVVGYQGYNLLAAENADVTLAAGAETKFATLQFTVKKTAAANTYKVGSTAPTLDTVLAVDGTEVSGNKANLTESQADVVVSKYPVKATVGEYEDANINNKNFYDANGVAVKVEDLAELGGVTATLEGPDGFDTVETAKLLTGTVADVTGEYTLTVDADGWAKAEVYTFTVHAVQLAATLNFDAKELKAEGYKAGEEIEVSVSIKELADGVTASVIRFNVIYDTAKLDLAVTGANTSSAVIENEGMQVVYDGTTTPDEATVANGVEFATLTFTVKPGAALGNISIASGERGGYPQNFAIADAFVTEDTELGDANPIDTVIVTDDFATPDTSAHTTWVNTDYEVYVTANDTAVEVKYAVVSGDVLDPATASQKEIMDVFDAAKPLTEGKFWVDTENDYYVVSKIGSNPAVYQLDVLKNGVNIWLDKKPPTLTVPKGTEGWAKAYVKSLSEFDPTDALSQIDTAYGVQYTTGNDTWTAVTDEAPMNIVDFAGDVTVRVKDMAGNITEEKIAVQVDTTAPTVQLTDNGYVTGAKKEIVIDAADENGNANSGLVADAKIYYTNSPLATEDVASIEALEGTTITLVEGACTYEAGLSGTYYVVVKDDAGNKGFNKLFVEVEKVADTAALQVKTVKKDTAYHTGFQKVDEIDVWDDNGYYTYVDLTTAAVDGHTSSITVNDALYTPGTGIEAESVDAEAKEVVVVVKTWLNGAEDTNYAEDTYKFNIVGAANMPSVNNDGRYNVLEISRIRRVLLKTNMMPEDGDGFDTGKFSGDMNGDLAYSIDDISQLVKSFRNFGEPGAYYDLGIMNQTKVD